MGAPQIIYIILCAIGGVIIIARNGQPKTGNYSFGSWLIANVLALGLLWWGGFFA